MPALQRKGLALQIESSSWDSYDGVPETFARVVMNSPEIDSRNPEEIATELFGEGSAYLFFPDSIGIGGRTPGDRGHAKTVAKAIRSYVAVKRGEKKQYRGYMGSQAIGVL